MLVGYARVSTPEQNINLQIDGLKNAGVDERNIFKESISGAIRARPALQEMLSFLKEGDTLIVYKLDRLARSLPNIIEIFETLKDKKANFKSLTENIDTSSPTGQMMFYVIAMMAEFERAVSRERSIAGMEAARKRGVKYGRKSVMTPEREQKIKEMLREKKTFYRISKTLGISIPPIRRLVSAPDFKLYTDVPIVCSPSEELSV